MKKVIEKLVLNGYDIINFIGKPLSYYDFEKVKKLLEEEVNPKLAEHFGGAEFVQIKEDTVYIKMLGACGGCPSVQTTIEEVIEEIILKEVPQIKRVCLYQGVSDEMIDFAKRILAGER